MSLALALAVFVFGLLPQARGRLPYREFLRRSWALPLVTFGVGSLLFDGAVLLGLGHQVPASGGVEGHGWAVTVAAVVGLLSIASIVLLLARTVRAIDPSTGADVQAAHLHGAIGEALRAELSELAALQILSAATRQGTIQFELWPNRREPGRILSARRASPGVVRDVKLRRLTLLHRYNRWRGKRLPSLHVWPGETFHRTVGLLTIDPTNSRLIRLWARSCFRVRAAPADALSPALATLHAETLDQVRAARPVEAEAGMRAMADLLPLVWQAYRAHGWDYDQAARRAFGPLKDVVGDRIIDQLRDEFRTAATSPDERIRHIAARLPWNIARRALDAKAAGSLEPGLGLLVGMYDAVVADLTTSGALPAAGVARRLITVIIESLLGFINDTLRGHIDQAAGTLPGAAETDEIQALEAAEFAAGQLRVANERMAAVLRRAVEVRDTVTLRRALPLWRMPETARLEMRVWEDKHNARVAAGGDGESQQPGEPEAVQRRRQLYEGLDSVEKEFLGRWLRLLTFAIEVEREAFAREDRDAIPTAVDGTPDTNADAAREMASSTTATTTGQALPGGDVATGPDRAVQALLDNLPAGSLWQALGPAIRLTDDEEWRQPPSDDEISPFGVTIGGPDEFPSLLEAFVQAVVVRPDLTAESEPDRSVAQDHGQALIAAADRVKTRQGPWLHRYGVTDAHSTERCQMLIEQITSTQHAAEREEQERVLATPIDAGMLDRFHADASTGFREAEILGGLLAWAGLPLTNADEAAADVVAEAPLRGPRDFFLGDTYQLSNIAISLGRQLAEQVTSALVAAASRHATPRTIDRADAATELHAAIQGLVADRATKEAPDQPSGFGIVAFIPADQRLIDALALTATEDAQWRHRGQDRDTPSARDELLTALSLSEPEKAWHLAGRADGAVVIQTDSVSAGAIVVIDLTRFARVRMAAAHPDTLPEPQLELIEPDEARVRAECQQRLVPSDTPEAPHLESGAAGAGPAALEDCVRENMLQVSLYLRQHGEIAVEATSAVRILTWK